MPASLPSHGTHAMDNDDDWWAFAESTQSAPSQGDGLQNHLPASSDNNELDEILGIWPFGDDYSLSISFPDRDVNLTQDRQVVLQQFDITDDAHEAPNDQNAVQHSELQPFSISDFDLQNFSLPSQPQQYLEPIQAVENLQETLLFDQSYNQQINSQDASINVELYNVCEEAMDPKQFNIPMFGTTSIALDPIILPESATNAPVGDLIDPSVGIDGFVPFWLLVDPEASHMQTPDVSACQPQISQTDLVYSNPVTLPHSELLQLDSTPLQQTDLLHFDSQPILRYSNFSSPNEFHGIVSEDPVKEGVMSPVTLESQAPTSTALTFIDCTPNFKDENKTKDVDHLVEVSVGKLRTALLTIIDIESKRKEWITDDGRVQGSVIEWGTKRHKRATFNPKERKETALVRRSGIVCLRCQKGKRRVWLSFILSLSVNLSRC